MKKNSNNYESDTLKNDVLISLCFSNVENNKESFSEVEILSQKIQKSFKFFEIIIIINSSEESVYNNLKFKIKNLRLISIGDEASDYTRRVVLAEESIGDIVAITRTDELVLLPLDKMIIAATDTKNCVTANGKYSKSILREILNKILSGLGKIACFRVDIYSFSTIVFTRQILNILINHPDPFLATRFLPIGPFVKAPVVFSPHKFSKSTFRLMLLDRYFIVYRILINLSPTLLNMVVLLSFSLCLIGFMYFFYVVITWALFSDLQPGWVTTSIMLAATSIFMGATVTGLALALQQILYIIRSRNSEWSIKEINQIDSFSNIQDELNVELSRSTKSKIKKVKKPRIKNV